MALYDQHAIHMAHSLYESGAKSCVEAMARGQAVVSSRVGAMKEHVREGENGFLVEVGDADSMAKNVLCLLRDPALTHRVGEAARASVRHLGWDECARAAVELYRRVGEMRSMAA